MKNQFAEFKRIIKIIHENNLVDQIILIGSWAYYLYCNKMFSQKVNIASLRTTDIDFFIPRHTKFRRKINLIDVLEVHGYEHIQSKSGADRFLSIDFGIEFLTEEVGRGSHKAYHVKDLDLHTIQIRYMNLLREGFVYINVDSNIKIKIPNPENFALHKLLISTQRLKEAKAIKDREQGITLLDLLIQNKLFHKARNLYATLHKKWKQKVDLSLRESDMLYLLEKLKEV